MEPAKLELLSVISAEQSGLAKPADPGTKATTEEESGEGAAIKQQKSRRARAGVSAADLPREPAERGATRQERDAF